MKDSNQEETQVVALRECPALVPIQTQNETHPTIRTLKIEEDGDRWNGFKPKIRLMGRWLERAGFKPGSHVNVKCVAPGVIELCSGDASAVELKPTSTKPSENPF